MPAEETSRLDSKFSVAIDLARLDEPAPTAGAAS
jgi:hypothetical protein